MSVREVESHWWAVFAAFCALDPEEWLGERGKQLVGVLGDLDDLIVRLELGCPPPRWAA